jgi:hypothetical protein
MAMTSIFILITIVATFAVFGIVLAWGEYQTRHLVSDVKQGREKEGRSSKPETVTRMNVDRAKARVETVTEAA